MSAVDPASILGICSQPTTLNGEFTYGLCLQAWMTEHNPEDSPFNGMWIWIQPAPTSTQGELWMNPMYASEDAPETVRATTGSWVKQVLGLRPENNNVISPDLKVDPQPITDVSGNIAGYAPTEFEIQRNWKYIIVTDPEVYDFPPAGAPSDLWSEPLLYLDPALFEEPLPEPEPTIEIPVDGSPLLNALKGLFLEELRADDGWDRYVDFLLSEVDVSFLRFGATQGVPYDFRALAWVDGLLADANPKDFPIGIEDEGATLVYPNPACPARLDFGTVSVLFGPMVQRVEIDLGNGEVNTVDFPQDPAYETPRSLPTPVTISGAGSFTVHLLTAEGAPTLKEYPLFRLAELPEDVNPAAVQQYRLDNFMLLDRQNPPITPAQLFDQIRALGDFKFYVAFKTVDGYGSRVASYEEYVHVLDTTKQQDTYGIEYWGLTLSAHVPLDALRDKIGAGIGASDIIGYDKGYLVSRASVVATPLYLLQASNAPKLPTSGNVYVSPAEISLNQRGTNAATLSVRSTAGGFTTDFEETAQETYQDMLLGWRDADGGLILLTNPINYAFKVSTGFTKYYDMLSYPAGPIESIDVFIEALESQLVSQYGRERYDQLMAALAAILKAATPAWADATVNFVYPQVSSMVELSDEWVGNQQEILVNGKSLSTAPADGVAVRLDQRGNTAVINIMTRPAADNYDVELVESKTE